MNTDYLFYEKSAAKLGFKCVAGGDEAGRGPWAGPVFAAFVVLPQNYYIDGLDDSKKLSRNRRKELFETIKTTAVKYSIAMAQHTEIDQINILEATRLAFKRAFEPVKPFVDYVLLDYIELPWLSLPAKSFPKGESVSASIAAASILAKESRDQYMEKMAQQYPYYGFEKHKGYGTKMHIQALNTHGPSPIHRKTFKPVIKALKK